MRVMSLGVGQTQSYSFDRKLILTELERTLAAVSESEIAAAQSMILAANRLFVTGAGRTGLALKMAAMRLMHLGLVVHVAGEVTTPAIGPGDLLLVASGSGTTAGPVHAAEVAVNTGARVLALTASPGSKLATLARRGRDSGGGQAGSWRSHL
ncbi:MAG TPA: SIS domain-containing protein [Terracidiphilus sp.]|nr:SIS domain-containing protein [Terracidiphilus sp.]